MTAFLMALLAASVSGSLMWLIIASIRPLTKRVFSQTWHYYTGLVPAFFLTGAAWIMSSGIDAFVTLIQTNPAVLTGRPLESGIAYIPRTFLYSGDGIIEQAGEAVVHARMSIEWLVPFILAAWLIGTLIFLLWKVTAYTRFRCGIVKLGKPATDTNCKLPVFICPGITTPMLIGVFKPVIILPECDYSEREREMILSHETSHWRHGDMFIRLFLLLANALHWFNPLAYRISKDAVCLCENACDEIVARNMDTADRVLYGELILATAAYEKTPALCSGMSEGTNLKRRLSFMLASKKMKRPVMILAVLVVCVIIASGVWLAVPFNKVAAYGNEMSIGSIEDESGILIENDEAIYVKGRKAVHMSIDKYNVWVAAGKNEADVYNFAAYVSYTPIGKGPDERMQMTIDDYKAWAAAGENDADVYDFAEKLNEADINDTLSAETPAQPFLWPLTDYLQISAPFHTPLYSDENVSVFHDGIDIPAPSGTPILAAKSGTIIETGYNETNGFFIRIDHGGQQQTVYMHLSKIMVLIDDTVKQGDVIGEVGNTGNSTGDALHFGINIAGDYINPLESLE